jgi:Ca2+-binding RTX toxin-like protein
MPTAVDINMVPPELQDALNDALKDLPPNLADIIQNGSATPAGTSGNANNVKKGTEGNDTLIGTAGDDSIEGLGGNDSIAGNGGNDTPNASPLHSIL